ncbi:MAG: flavin reductase family protein [Eubacteriales bacterium]
MNLFHEIKPTEMTANAFEEIGSRWLMIGCRDSAQNRINLMTASWGAVGVLWGKPVCILFVRKSRHTHKLIGEGRKIGVSIFGEEYREQLKLCGKLSGRDTDKVSLCGFTPLFEDEGAVCFEQAERVLCLKKLYEDEIRPEAFVDPSLVDKWYSDRDFHTMYVCEIEKILEKNPE